MNAQLVQDLEHTYQKLSKEERAKISGSRILITGAAGFLGYYLVNFFYYFRDALNLEQVICLDNFILGEPEWVAAAASGKKFQWRTFDIIKDKIDAVSGVEAIDFVIHMASIASPTFYRQHPIETLDANVWGLRQLLDFYKERQIKGFLFFSSSEIYGDPIAEAIPTNEQYCGNVSPTGPRACYDEAKRFGETMCALFARRYQMPIGVVRPFNNYGPGMRLEDRRVPADFAKQVLNGENIQILSNGSPTRTFCYVADAAAGYLKAMVHGKYDYFNIGMEKPEVSMRDLAGIYQCAGRELFGYQGEILYARSEDQHYLTDNPQRRCPDISKARSLLDYQPEISIRDGVRRFLRYLREELTS